MWKNKSFLQSIKYSMIGIKRGFEIEKNFKTNFFICFFLFVLNCFLKINIYGFVLHLVLSCLLLSLECINTAIELLCDLYTEEKNEKIKDIKDIASGAVLYVGIACLINEVIFIGKVILDSFPT